jgi:hypothetical protein
MLDSFAVLKPGFQFWKLENEYVTAQYVAVKYSVSDEEIRRAVKFLLDRETDPEKRLILGVDVKERRPKPGAVRNVRKSFRQFRINRVTGVAKIEAYLFLAPEVANQN